MKPYLVEAGVDAVANYVIWADSPQDARDRIAQDDLTDHLTSVTLIGFNQEPTEWEVKE